MFQILYRSTKRPHMYKKIDVCVSFCILLSVHLGEDLGWCYQTREATICACSWQVKVVTFSEADAICPLVVTLLCCLDNCQGR